MPEPPAELASLSERLCRQIIDEIERDGPMPFDRFISMALYEPGLGYYVNGLHKFGQAGDFVTAPEQGGLFSAALARQCDEVASEIGAAWTLLELGAGSGVLARDLLAGLQSPPHEYLILEPSAPLREVQRETLAELPEEVRERVRWIDTPPEHAFAGVIVGNEVIDALPVARFEIGEDGPLEQCVDFDGERFRWISRPPRPRVGRAIDELQRQLARPLPTGYASEIAVDLPGWIDTVTRPLARGLVLFVDYGYPREEYYHRDRSDGTLVGHYRHRAHFDPFVWPGLTDLSAFVDFTCVAEAGHDAELDIAGFTTQSGFLLALGAHEAVEQAEDNVCRLQLAGELKRLTLPGEMGEKFKVIAMTRDLDVRLSGFELMSQLHRL